MYQGKYVKIVYNKHQHRMAFIEKEYIVVHNYEPFNMKWKGAPEPRKKHILTAGKHLIWGWVLMQFTVK